MSMIEQRQQAIRDAFDAYDDWMMKYEYIIELGRQLPSVSDEVRTDAYLIRGCQSKVWVRVTVRDGLLHIEAESDSLIVKGLAALVYSIFEGVPPHEARDAQITIFHDIGLDQHLSPARANGFVALLRQIQAAAANAAA